MAAIIATTNSRSTSRLPRVGIDPGIFNLKIWPARIGFSRNGHRLVEQGYQKVCRRYRR